MDAVATTWTYHGDTDMIDGIMSLYNAGDAVLARAEPMWAVGGKAVQPCLITHIYRGKGSLTNSAVILLRTMDYVEAVTALGRTESMKILPCPNSYKKLLEEFKDFAAGMTDEPVEPDTDPDFWHKAKLLLN